MEAIHSALGTFFYTVVVFVAGGFIGKPLWDWASKKFPWNK